MDILEKGGLKGAMCAVLAKYDDQGNFLGTEVTEKHNLIVNNGFDMICNALGNSGARPATLAAIAVGTGTTPPAAGDTLLTTELNRQAGTYGHTAGTKQFTMQASYGAGVATGAIAEAGVFNATGAGVAGMLNHVQFPVINKGVNDTLTITFTFTLS